MSFEVSSSTNPRWLLLTHLIPKGSIKGDQRSQEIQKGPQGLPLSFPLRGMGFSTINQTSEPPTTSLRRIRLTCKSRTDVNRDRRKKEPNEGVITFPNSPPGPLK